SSPPPDHRASRASGRRHPYWCQKKAAKATALAFAGHAATPGQTPSPRLIDFVPERQATVKRILIFFPWFWYFLYPAPRIVGSNLADGSKILIWRRPGPLQPAVPAAASQPPHALQTPK